MEKKQEQKPNNSVHLHGYINDVRIIDFERGAKNFIVDMATLEAYKDNNDEMQRRYTYHKVSVVTSDKKFIKSLEEVKADLDANFENRDVEGYKNKNHTATVDGVFCSRKNEKDGVTYVNNLIVAQPDDFKVDTKLAEGESRNRAEFKGNIAKINTYDEFAVITIATHYYAPTENGELVENFRGEMKPYIEKVSYIDTRLNGNRRPGEFERIQNGDIAVGDLIEVRGQIHNNNYTDANGVNRYKMAVDLNKLTVVAKKGQKVAEAAKEEKKAEKKAGKKVSSKAAPKRKKGVTM